MGDYGRFLQAEVCRGVAKVSVGHLIGVGVCLEANVRQAEVSIGWRWMW